MQLKKTTILSAFIVVAGLVSEIMFRDVFMKTVSGMVLSLVLAVIIFLSFYFLIDGGYTLWTKEREMTKKHQKELEQKLYTVLTEQLKFQKIIYNEVRQLGQESGVRFERKESLFDLSPMTSAPVEAVISEEEINKIVAAVDAHTAQFAQNIEELLVDINYHAEQTGEGAFASVPSARPLVSAASQTDMEQMVEKINDHTMNTAKVVVKYISRTTEELKKLLNSA